YGRGGGYMGFVSRYGDLLALGVTANGVALWRLGQAARAGRAWAATGLALVWLATVAQGLQLVSTRGHTEYFDERSERWAQLRHNAVQDYLVTKDISHLSSEEVRKVLYPNPELVAHILDHPGLVQLLPASLRPDPSPTRGNFLSDVAARVRSAWAELAAAGGVVL